MPQTVDVLLDKRGLALAQLSDATMLSLERLDAIVNGRWDAQSR